MKHALLIVLSLLVVLVAGASAADARSPRVRLTATYGAQPAPPTHAIRLLTPAGDLVGEPWQSWIDASRVSTGAYTLVLDPSLDCGDALGCSTGPLYGAPRATTNVSMSAGRFSARTALYFELGHQFDWHFLTDADRRYLARAWGVPRARWWDSMSALAQNAEDGLEADFAIVYQDCAWGTPDMPGIEVRLGTSQQSTVHAPRIHPTINTCAFVDRLAALGAHQPAAAAG